MKKILLTMICCLLAAYSFAQNADSYEGQSFGDGVTKGGVITADKVESKLGKSSN